MANLKHAYQFLNGVDAKKLTWMDSLPPTTEAINDENLKLFFRTMFERQEIWFKRFILKRSAPWTEDPFMSTSKFTNVYRELDRSSQWLIKNVYFDDSLSDIDLIWKIIIYRFFNQPDTFDVSQKVRVELPKWKDFNAEKMYEQVIKVRESGRNPWHTAYMMNMAFLPKTFEPERGLFKDYAYVMHAFKSIHSEIQRLYKKITIAKHPEAIIEHLETFPATAGFQSHEFFIDFCYINKYTDRKFFKYTENDYTNVGPGASLGLRLIFPSTPPKEQKQRIYDLREISEEMLKKVSASHFEYERFPFIIWDKGRKEYQITYNNTITLHQIEMWLCEFSKYWKMQLGKGKQRSKFQPAKLQTKIY